MNNRKFTPKGGDWKKSTNNAHGAKLKRKWVPEQKVYEGSVQEGKWMLNITNVRSEERQIDT